MEKATRQEAPAEQGRDEPVEIAGRGDHVAGRAEERRIRLGEVVMLPTRNRPRAGTARADSSSATPLVPRHTPRSSRISTSPPTAPVATTSSSSCLLQPGAVR
ncbi:hypothetical protein [Streptomyces guryensis]|uniref:Uncharacterized protein n=1 Tax=Streptomyces guryensis TaxID=2886947 RepID=A0A9Q3VPT5_9ACTN|nr:hypothetical protein [Streptomyces guryensis]MCD9875977.1 hypothetical protein [Streptomyces guryensis]